MKYCEIMNRLPADATSGAPRPMLASMEIQLIAEKLATRQSAQLEDITLADIVQELRRPSRELAVVYERTPSGKLQPRDPEDAEWFRRYESLLSLLREYVPELGDSCSAGTSGEDSNKMAKGADPLVTLCVGYDNYKL
ncbi:MAG: hypothetical protein AABY26_00470, partial [Nanoarchaeota archaeon]